MTGRRSDLPIMIGKRLRKGIFAFRDVKKGGYNLCVVWLKKEYESGEEYDMADIDKFDAVLHFCDKESIEQTIKVLQWMLKQGVAEQTDCKTCKYGQDKHRYEHICNECGVGINNYTPQNERRE